LSARSTTTCSWTRIILIRRGAQDAQASRKARHDRPHKLHCAGPKTSLVPFWATAAAFAARNRRRGSAVVFRMRPRRPARDIFGVTRAGGASTPQNRSISDPLRATATWRNRRRAIHIGATTSVLRN